MGLFGNLGCITLLTKKCFHLATGVTAVLLVNSSLSGFRGFMVIFKKARLKFIDLTLKLKS
jgi:hypothetical protein